MIPNGLMGFDPTQLQPIDPASFAQSMARTFQFEGGLNKRDTNGTPSNYGVNQAANPDVNVTALSKPQAADLYKQRYWDTIGGDSLPGPLAHVAFDTSVIAGPGKAKELLAQSGNDPQKFMDLREKFLGSLVNKDPDKYGKYEGAWANRNQTLRNDASNWDATGGNVTTPVSTAATTGTSAVPPLPPPIDVATVPEPKGLMAGPPDPTAIGDANLADAKAEAADKADKEKEQLAGLDMLAKGIKGDQTATPSVLAHSGSMLSDDQAARMQAAQALMANLMRPRGLMG